MSPHEQTANQTKSESGLTEFQCQVVELYRRETQLRVARALALPISKTDRENGETQRERVNWALDVLASELKAAVELLESSQ